MKETLEVLKEFLNDFIGHVVPGAVLLVSLFVLFNWPITLSKEVISSGAFTLIAVAIFYGAGHAMSALHGLLLPILKKLQLAADEDASLSELESSGKAEEARAAVGAAATAKGRELRNYLMTRSPQAKYLAVRFQHLALLYAGVALALWSAGAARIYAKVCSPDLLRTQPTTIDWIVQSCVVLVIGIGALRKGREFHLRSLRVPFSAGVAEITAIGNVNEKVSTQPGSGTT